MSAGHSSKKGAHTWSFDLNLSKKEREERLPQGIQLANGLKARVGTKKQIAWH